MLKILFQIGLLILIAGLVFFVKQYFFPSPPSQTHDILGLGYPDDASKPVQLAEAEKILQSDWGNVVSSGRNRIYNYEHWTKKHLPDSHKKGLYFFNEEEQKRYHKIVSGAHLLKNALMQYEVRTNIDTKSIRDISHRYILIDYLENQLGLGPYNIHKPSDQETLKSRGFDFSSIPKADLSAAQ